MTVRTEDLTTSARLREAALLVFSEIGYSAATVRRIATAAGVSHGLVLHHFGNKEGLKQSVDDMVLAEISAAMGDPPGSVGHDDPLRSRRLGLVHLLRDRPVLAAYIRQSLCTDDQAGAALFDRILREGLRRRSLERAAGQLPEEANPDDADLAAVAVALLPVLLRPHLERVLGTDLGNVDGIDRWLQAERAARRREEAREQ